MGRRVPAVTRALDILELFLDGDGTLSAPDIVRRLQLPRTTVHELVTTLAARKYIVPVAGQPGRYRLTLDLDEPVDVVTFDSFSAFRKRVHCTIDETGRTIEKTSNGRPHVELAW